MAWLVINDQIDYEAMWYPTHIVGKENDLIPVFIGAASTMLSGYIGIYVREKDYNKIRHDKAYILIHDPDIEADAVDNINWDEVKDVKEKKTVNRDHIHLWKEPEFEGEA